MQTDTTPNLREWLETDSPTYLVNPTQQVLREVAATLDGESGTLRCLVVPETFRSYDREYSSASRMAKLVRDGVVEFRALHGTHQANLLVGEDIIGAFLDLKEFTLAVGAPTGDVDGDGIIDLVTSLWEQNEELELRTPPSDDIRHVFELTCGEEVHDVFEEVAGKIEGKAYLDRQNEEIVFPDRRFMYGALVIAGAVSEVSLQELGNATETSGLASRSTLSRIKQVVEDAGIISTRSIDSDVGRPPMQLHVSEVYSHEPLDEVVNRVYTELESETGA